MVHHGDCEGVVDGKEGGELVHSPEQRVQAVGDVALPVVYLVLANLHFDVRV